MFGNSNGPLVGNGDAFLKSNFGLESRRSMEFSKLGWERGNQITKKKTQGTDPNHVSRSYGLWKSTL
jgi:hypothetical protein